MYFRTLFVVVLVVLILTPPAESWWRRRRRRRRAPPPPECWRRRRRRRRRAPPPPPPPDTTPPHFPTCGDITRITRSTTSSERRIRVTFSTPTATDTRGTPTVSRISGLASGSYFSEGSTMITFRATDPAGNTADCRYQIIVTVPRCPSIPGSSPRTYTCTKSRIVGSACTFHCTGSSHDLFGLSRVTCGNNRQWSRAFPQCRVKTCSPTLTRLTHGSVSCSNSNRYNSVCTFRCNTCYGFPSGSSTYVRTCGLYWSGSTPTCRDICPPTFTSCPSGISVEAASGSTSAVVFWDIPEATDNVAGVTVTRIHGPERLTTFEQGSYSIVYRAVDAAGNTESCSFSVTVRVIICSPAPQSGNHLSVNCPLGHIKGATCTFSCSTGYQLVGSTTSLTCLASGSWSGSQPSCAIRRCTNLAAPSGGSFISTCGNTFGTRCRFQCNTGYRLTGSASRQCSIPPGQTDVSWSGTTTRCQINTCQTLVLGEGMSSATSGACQANSQVPYGTTCSYTCSQAYRLIGSQTVECGPNGQWLQSLPQCQEITCASSNLPVPINGVKSDCPGGDVSYGTTCSLSCNQGYTPTQPVLRTCDRANDNGVWSAGTITCTIVTCSPLSAPAHGAVSSCVRSGESVSVTGRQPFNSHCFLVCRDGYTLQGSASRTCLVSGSWDGSTTTCTDVTPPVLQCPSDVVLFAGEGQITISIPWNWEPFTGTDAGRNIPAVLQTINSDPVTGSKPTSLAEGIYTLVYAATDSAGNSDSCTMQMETKLTRCLGLQTPTQGSLRLVTGHGSCSDSVTYGSQCEISCGTGYTLSTEGTVLRRQCMRSSAISTQGYWSATQPTCIAITCVLPTVTNGCITNCPGDTATYGDTCQFHCDLGHRSSSGESSRARQCQAHRTWSGPDFQCTVTVTCPGSFSLPNGQVDPDPCRLSTELPYGTECEFSCGDGFRQDGPASKTCSDSRSWSPVQNVRCVDEQSPTFNGVCPRRVTVNSVLGTTTQTVTFDPPTAQDNSDFVTVTRQAGHPAPGSTFSEGTTTVTYIATDPVGNSEQCSVHVTVVVHRCERLSAPASGSIQCDHTSPIAGTVCTLGCNTGYTLSGFQSRTCQLTNDDAPYWDGSTTLCTIVTCPSQDAPANSIKSGCDQPSQSYGTECSFSCVYGYEADTSDGGRSRCRADGTWSGTDLVCSAIVCQALDPAPGVTVAPPSCLSQPIYGQVCSFSCSQPGFRIEPMGRTIFAHCIGESRWSEDVTAIHCVDVRNPEFDGCPSSLTIYADRGTSTGQLDLQLTATDNDGNQPTVTCQPGSGSLSLGDHSIACVATDTAGNAATCSFQVEVVERVCPDLPLPAYGVYEGDCCNTYGCRCHLGCLSGYELVGSRNTSCEFDGTSTYWQRAEVPHCRLITCDVLSLPGSVHVTPQICTAGTPPAGTQCYFFCLHGLQLVGGASQTACTLEGTWDVTSNNLPTRCQDLIPPVLTFCPGPTYATRDGPEGVSVTFDIPMARDNDPSSALTVETVPTDITSPHLFTESTEVSYTFSDEAGNSVTCSFRIYVMSNLEPVVEFCPDDYSYTATDRLTDVTWEEPRFRDLLGFPLTVSNNLAEGNTAKLPWDRHTVVYTAINEETGQKAACQFAIEITPNSCPPLESPQNGALTCTPSGDVCTAFCHENYMFPRSRGLPRPDQYVCGLQNGKWLPHDLVPDCARRRGDAMLPVNLMYFSGDCSDQSTQDSIANAFIAMIQASPFMNACSLTNKCNIENVQVMCGAGGQQLGYSPGAQRRRRAALTQLNDLEDDPVWDRLFARLDATRTQRRKRDVDTDFGLFIKFDMVYEIDYEEGIESSNAVVTTETVLKNEADDLMTAIVDGSLPPMNAPDISLEVDTEMSSYDDPKVICKPGYVISNDTLYCVACSSGTRYNQATEECDSCPRGSYQNLQAMLSCNTCPPGMTTEDEGAKNSSYCKDMCPAGKFSNSSVVPCLQCLMGYYQPERGQSLCQACPDGTTTLGYGAQSEDQCLEICPAGSYSSTGLAPCTPCDHRYYQPNTQKRLCVLCPGRTATLQTGSTSLEQCIDADGCVSSPCNHDATCVDLIDGYRCDCPPGYQGVHCQENIDDCPGHRCTNGATCVDEVMGYQCQCLPGFQGGLCEMNIDECVSSPCQHNGICQDAVNGYVCQCTSGFHGVHCEQEINSCSPSPCHNGATCQLLDGGYQCQCAPGYRGINCTLDINECNSSPCLNGATCQDMPNAYRCECASGYEGVRCETDVDLCASSPCHDGASCVDLTSTFACHCPPYRSGHLCDQTPCQNGGTFIERANSYACNCVPGFNGVNCEDPVDECLSSPCSNGGSCIDQVNSFRCDCPLGFQGPTCELEVDWCSSNPCASDSTCENAVNGYTCQCGTGMTGTHCEDHIDYCANTECQHGATCTNMDIGYRCQCVIGFAGHDCEINVNECQSNPCQHGFCIDQDNGFMCLCRAGFKGSSCNVNIDDCPLSNCQNGGTCVDGTNDYTCICADGFTGTLCQEPVDYCQSSPCQHQGTCLNKSPGYECLCPSGYVGVNCEEDFDECSLHECIHASSCTDGINSFTCTCNEGYTGFKCDMDIDECMYSPCESGGRCVNLVAGFMCQCLDGFDGQRCEMDVDECVSTPCQNNGTCLDLINAFQCLCTQGWTGEQCGFNIDDCAFNPCENGGECLDRLNAYVCQCLPGYEGINCQLDINECQEMNVVCENGGTCIDKVDDFECLCILGYRGRYCDENVNECQSNPCRNDGTCVDGVASFSCECAIGYAGLLCEENILADLCAEMPCSNGGSCSVQGDGVACICLDGYSGELCDIDIDECASQPCMNPQSICNDMVNGYWCDCPPGYTGTHCETVMPADFDLVFDDPTPSDVVNVGGLIYLPVDHSLSLTLWMKSRSCSSPFTLVKLWSDLGTAVEIKNPFHLEVKILSHEFAIEGRTDFCDGTWHNLLLTLEKNADFEWKMYIDQILAGEGALSSPTLFIPNVLILTIGPEVDASQTQSGPSSCQVEISGLHVWDHAWSVDDVPTISSYCVSHEPGNVFLWGQMMSAPGAVITSALREPSLCDDYNECLSTPCLHGGHCENRLGTFYCYCTDDWIGDRCQSLPDLCSVDLCLNNGLCQNSNTPLGFTCHCLDGYTGQICENEIVDGEWGQWLPWHQCSKTCDGGRRIRFRTCDDPKPQNGGAQCQGNIFEFGDCNMNQCPACPVLRSPLRGFINCNETEAGEVACLIWCRDNFEFSSSVQAVYRCGPSSNYHWDHNPTNSRSVILPSCNPVVQRVAVQANVSVTYPNLYCSSQTDQDDITGIAMESLRNSTQESTSCLALNTCAANVSVSNCDPQGGRSARAVQERSVRDPVKVTFMFSMKELTGENVTALMDAEFDTALEGLAGLLQTGELGISHDGTVAQPDVETMDSDMWDICPEGTVVSDKEGYCVECNQGMIWVVEDSPVDYLCKLCPVNTYKEEGVNRCNQCPYNMITSGQGAVNITECYEIPGGKKHTDGPFNMYHVIILLIIGALFIIATGCLLNLRLRKRRKKASSTDKPSPCIHIIPDILEGGPQSDKNPQAIEVASLAGNALPGSEPTPSDESEGTKIIRLPTTKL